MQLAIIGVLCVVVIGLVVYIGNTQSAIKRIGKLIDDIEKGKVDTKEIAKYEHELSGLCYKVNGVIQRAKGEVEDAKQTEKVYRKLITNLSEDMEKPMAALNEYLDLMASPMPDEEERQHYIQQAGEKLTSLKHCTENLFQWMEVETGDQIFDFKKIDICEPMREVTRYWIPKMRQVGMKYDVDLPEKAVRLVVDEESFKRIIHNLLHNVFVHSKAAFVEIQMAEMSESVVIRIKDNGVGIQEEDLPHVFERFFRGQAIGGEKGNGLGLAIVQELVKANRGTIKVDSKPNEYCNFVLEFPKGNA